ncbi:MAG: hypothetical protein Q4P13_06800 [Psychrobacter sp.]|nr:hypothetical protein [Psychrobacter sp.]
MKPLLLVILLPLSLLTACQSMGQKTDSTSNTTNTAPLVSPQHAISRTFLPAANNSLQQQVVIFEVNKQLMLDYIETNVSDKPVTTFERRPNNCIPGPIYYKDDNNKLVALEDEIIIDIFRPTEDIILAPNESQTYHCMPAMLRRFPEEQRQYVLKLIQRSDDPNVASEESAIIDIPFIWKNNASLSGFLKPSH